MWRRGQHLAASSHDGIHPDPPLRSGDDGPHSGRGAVCQHSDHTLLHHRGHVLSRFGRLESCGGSSTVLDARTQRTSTLPSNAATRTSHPESHKAHMHPSGIDDRPGNHDIRGRHTPPRGVAARCDASGARAGGSSKIGGGSSRKSGIPILAASTTTTSSTSILSRPAIILQTPTRT